MSGLKRIVLFAVIAFATFATLDLIDELIGAAQQPTACQSAASDESSYLGQLALTLDGLPDFTVQIVTNPGRDGHAMPVERRIVHLRDYEPWVRVKADIRARAEAKRAEAMRGQEHAR